MEVQIPGNTQIIYNSETSEIIEGDPEEGIKNANRFMKEFIGSHRKN